MNTPNGNLYILIEHRFHTRNKEVVKIGRTDRTIAERKSEYPKDSKLLGSGSVYNSKIGEDELIKKFTKKFTRYFSKSREYYYGNLDQMIAYFYKCVYKIYNQQMRPLHDASFYKNHVPLPLVHAPMDDEPTSDDIADNIGDDSNDDPNDETYINESSDTEVLDNIAASNPIAHDNIEILDIINFPPTNNFTINTKTSQTKNNLTKTPVKTNSKKTSKRKTLKGFCKWLYDTQPEWYMEEDYVQLNTIMNSYTEYMDDFIPESMVAQISKQMNGIVYKGSKRVDSVNYKKLVSYDVLKEYYMSK